MERRTDVRGCAAVKKLRVTVDIPFERLDQSEPVEVEIAAPQTAKISVAPDGAASSHLAPEGGADVPPEVLAVIVATASQVLERAVRVHRIRYRDPVAAAASAAWAQQGRVAIMTSRMPRR
jgi:hypothetical protein